MVKGLVQEEKEEVKKDENKKNFQFKEEELESELTHAEIEEISNRYKIAWQSIFALDAEFWSLITIESEEKKKLEEQEGEAPA